MARAANPLERQPSGSAEHRDTLPLTGSRPSNVATRVTPHESGTLKEGFIDHVASCDTLFQANHEVRSLAHVIVVEDETELAYLIARSLREDGHTTEVLLDGQQALERLTGAARVEPDLIVLDLMLPNIDGLEITQRIRQERFVPILMLTAKSSEIDKVLGLELGADDYLTKPISMRELQARVSAILRRVRMLEQRSKTADDTATPIEDAGLRVDPMSREVQFEGQEIVLTAREFDLLYLLVTNPDRVFSRDYLLNRLWGDDYGGFERTIDTHIQRLRRKLGGSGSVADRITTLWGVGYKYERPD